MKYTLFMLCLLSVFLLFGQKYEERIINNPSIKTIIIEDDKIFKIDIKTSTSKSIKLVSKIEGEYSKNTKVISQINNHTLSITCNYPELTNKMDDKLNAHKVHSIELILEIPQHLNLYISSEIASAKIKGTYNYLLLELNQGNARLNHFLGNATINTINGNVNIETKNVTINALTKTGKIKREPMMEGKNVINVQSINGNINISKTKK